MISYFSEWTSLSTYPILNLHSSCLFVTALILVGIIALKKYRPVDEQHPPFIPSKIPFLGHSVEFAKSPVEFLLAAYEQYGPVFSFTMVGKTFTYLIGPEASTLFFNSRNENLNAEEVYSKLTTPVFGKGVAYDVPNEIFLEQKKLFKTGFSIEQFKKYIYLINSETVEYFCKWPSSGQNDIFKAFSELIILTASSCLHGKEIREILDENIAQLYFDLDSGFSHLAWVLPSWMPLPSFKKRDDAHLTMKEIFYQAIKRRRESGTTSDDHDMLQTLINAKYKSGRPLTDDEIAGLLIGLLLAGQHTSSTTSSWLGFFIAKHKDIQEALYKEQLRVFNGGDECLSYEGLKECQLLDWCLRETLRLRPPIVTMMRMCKTPQKILNFTIPPGHQVCVSPTTNHVLPESWDFPEEFIPYRFQNGVSEDKFSYVPFGAGRHRCIGEAFALVQIKTIWSYLIQRFEFDLVDGKFPKINVATMIHTPDNATINFKRR